MTLADWSESVKMAKIKIGVDPKKFTRVDGKLLKEAQAIYSIYFLINLNLKLKSLKILWLIDDKLTELPSTPELSVQEIHTVKFHHSMSRISCI